MRLGVRVGHAVVVDHAIFFGSVNLDLLYGDPKDERPRKVGVPGNEQKRKVGDKTLLNLLKDSLPARVCCFPLQLCAGAANPVDRLGLFRNEGFRFRGFPSERGKVAEREDVTVDAGTLGY